MSVAVASFSRVLKEQNTTPAPQPDLLEALLAACQKKPVSHAAYGRELQPYFGTTELSVLGQLQPTGRTKGVNAKRGNSKPGDLAPFQLSPPKNKANNKTPTTKKPTAAQAETARAKKMAAVMSAWAGPGFSVAPSPEKLPFPSAALFAS